MQMLNLDYIADRQLFVRRACFGGAATLLCLHLLIGAGSVRDRVVTVGITILMMYAAFWGIRLVIWFQVAMHGMTPFVRSGCAFFFWFFAIAVLWGFVAAAVGNRSWAVFSALGLMCSLAAVMAYVRYRSVGPKWPKAI